MPSSIVKILFIIVMLGLPIVKKQKDALNVMALQSWTMMAFIYGAGFQYFALLIALNTPLRIHHKAVIALTSALMLVVVWYLYI